MTDRSFDRKLDLKTGRPDFECGRGDVYGGLPKRDEPNGPGPAQPQPDR
jgi:hypothetical protein